MKANLHSFSAVPARRRAKPTFFLLLLILAQGLFVFDTASAAAARKPRDPAADRDRAGELLRNYRSGLLIVEGKSAHGSGFIADFKGRKFLVTNAHVLADIRDARFKLLDNTPIRLGAAVVAIGHDILMFTVTEGGTGIPTAASVTTEATFGDAVLVPGNAGGEGVVAPLQGEIVGIGPQRVEVSAPIEPGSSGSPIIHLNSGKVVGVATYLKIRVPDANRGVRVSSLGNVRRFGFRLDSVEKWEPVNWSSFYAQASAVEKFELTTTELESAFSDFGSSSFFVQQKHVYESRAISSAVDAYQAALTQNPANRGGAARTLLLSLRTISQSDLVIKGTLTYDYFRRRFEQAETERKQLLTAFDKLIENLR